MARCSARAPIETLSIDENSCDAKLFGMLRSLFLLLLLPTALNATYVWDLSICAIFQNEAMWLQEWIEYHQIVGVDHFVLFNHYSSDKWEHVLEPYIEEGIVEVIDWSDYPHHIDDAQSLAYDFGLDYLRGSSRWVAFIDIDEFMVPEKVDSMIEFLRGYEEYGGVVLSWQNFGTSGVSHLEPGELLIERLQRCAKYVGGWYKSVVQPDLTEKALSAHRFSYVDGCSAVDTYHNKVTRPTHWTIFKGAWINHYKLRTMDWAYGRKVSRVAHYRGWAEARARQSIEAEDRKASVHLDSTIQRFVPTLRQTLLGSSDK